MFHDLGNNNIYATDFDEVGVMSQEDDDDDYDGDDYIPRLK